MGSIRRFIWKCIWVCSFRTLGITVIYKDGVVIKLDSIWGEGDEPGVGSSKLDVGSSKLDVGSSKLDVGPNGLKDRTTLGCSPSTKVEYWDVR